MQCNDTKIKNINRLKFDKDTLHSIIALIKGEPFLFGVFMKQIKLTQNKFAIVDNDDYEYLNQFKWYAAKKVNQNIFYACRMSKTINGERYIVQMHRVIMGNIAGVVIDHINGNGIDNRKENLRKCTVKDNNRNKRISKNNQTGYKGVYYLDNIKNNKPYKYIIAQIGGNKNRRYLGTFKTLELAAIAYNESALKYYGEFANLNKIRRLK